MSTDCKLAVSFSSLSRYSQAFWYQPIETALYIGKFAII